MLPLILRIPGLSHLCSNIDVSKRNFIWVRWDKKKKYCMEFCDSLCKPKCVGGLDLKRVVDFNKALIAKLGQMIAEENSEEWG